MSIQELLQLHNMSETILFYFQPFLASKFALLNPLARRVACKQQINLK